jgi:hypothetical protein
VFSSTVSLLISFRNLIAALSPNAVTLLNDNFTGSPISISTSQDSLSLFLTEPSPCLTVVLSAVSVPASFRLSLLTPRSDISQFAHRGTMSSLDPSFPLLVAPRPQTHGWIKFRWTLLPSGAFLPICGFGTHVLVASNQPADLLANSSNELVILDSQLRPLYKVYWTPGSSSTSNHTVTKLIISERAVVLTASPVLLVCSLLSSFPVLVCFLC